MKTKAKWADRTIIRNHYKIGICTSEDDFNFELKRLKVPEEDWVFWLNKNQYAVVHYLHGANGELVMLVCIRKNEKDYRTILLHEAVHIFDAEMEYIEEARPSKELKAYAIENITQNLIEAYKK